MNEGDGDYCALYIDGKKSFESWSGPIDPDELLQALFSKLNGNPMTHMSIEHTNLPFYDDDENELSRHGWPDELPTSDEEV
jgi:hypothetical protein